MSSTLEKVITALTQAGITKQDFEQRDPKGVALKYIEDYLAPEINQKISRLLTSTDLKPGEILELHRSVVNYLNSVGYNNFKAENLNIYEELIKKAKIKGIEKEKDLKVEDLKKLYALIGSSKYDWYFEAHINEYGKHNIEIWFPKGWDNYSKPWSYGLRGSAKCSLHFFDVLIKEEGYEGKKDSDFGRRDGYVRKYSPKLYKARIVLVKGVGGPSQFIEIKKNIPIVLPDPRDHDYKYGLKVKKETISHLLDIFIEELSSNYDRKIKRLQQKWNLESGLTTHQERELNLFLRGRAPTYNPVTYRTHFDTWKKEALKQILKNLP